MLNFGKGRFRIFFLILIVVFLVSLSFPIYAAEMARCEININKYFAVGEYFTEKTNVLKDETGQTIDSLNSLYYNFIAKPTSNNAIKDTYLFRPLVYNNIDQDEFSVVGFKKDEQILCGVNKIVDCITTISDEDYKEKEQSFNEIGDKTFSICTSGNSICLNNDNGNITCVASSCEAIQKRLSCSSSECISLDGEINFIVKVNDANYNVSQKKLCFPPNHICKVFKKDVDLYFLVDQYYFDSTKTQDKNYYVYEKNPLLSNNKNCELGLFRCDFKVKNESVASNEKNVVYVSTTNEINRVFVENINAGLGKMAFFRFIGSCSKNTTECRNIIAEYNYYKYINRTTDTVYYFEKNFVNQKGLICDGYLPNCRDMNLKIALYDNTTGDSVDNNQIARRTFYTNQGADCAKVGEENLWFVNSNNFSNASCLNVEGNTNNATYKGYCSDLNETMTGLVYSNGFEVSKNNCYLKSCIDLTPDEIRFINNSSGGKKFCSEFVWLNNNFSFKYFPKEKPVFCSDVENGNLKFPQGFEAQNPKCYLKNCFSLENDMERELIVKNTYEDFLDKTAWAYNIQGKGGGTEHNMTEYYRIRKYCYRGLFFTRDNPLFSKLDFLNFNINFCNDFADKQLIEIKNKNFVPIFSKFFENNEYDTYTNSYFCRTHIAPYNRGQESANATFLRNSLIGLDERRSENIKSSYMDMFSRLYGYGIADFPSSSYSALRIREMDNYGKLLSSKVNDSILRNNANFGNYCNYVDNLFLYRDASIDELSPVFNPNTGETVTYPTIKNTKIYNDSAVIKNDVSYYDVLTNNIFFKATKYNECSKNCPDTSKDATDCVICESKTTNEERKKCFTDRKDCAGNLCILECKNNNLDEEKYYDIQNIIFSNIIDCRTYNSTARRKNDYSFFDCDLYINDKETLSSKIIPYLTKLKPVQNTKEQEYFVSLLKEKCNAEYFVEEEKNTVMSGSYISSLIRPYVSSNVKYSTFNSYKNIFERAGSLSLNSQSRARAGCSVYQKTYSEGIMQPKDYSMYFDYENNNLINSLNNPSKSKNVNQDFFYKIPLCFRGSDVGGNVDKCGLREGYGNKDKCIEVNTASGVNNSGFFNSDSSSITETYYSAWDSGRDVYYIQRVKTDRDMNATNDPDYFDKKAFDQVSAECLIVSIPIGLTAFGVCVFVSTIFSWICPAVGAGAAAFAQAGCMLGRWNEYNFEFEGGLVSPYEYLRDETKESMYGFLSPITLINNDNYYYNYYPRSIRIEEDIKNQISYNKDKNTSARFFHKTTRSYDIMKHCNISDMLVDENKCLENKNSTCSFKIRKYKKDSVATADGYCEESYDGDFSKCLSDKQRECLKSFGIEFLRFKTLVNKNFMSNNIFTKYEDGSKMTWFKNRDNDRKISEIPVNIIPLAKYKGKEEDLINNANCLLDKYGDPITDLSKCRVIDYDGFIATESQSLKKPLLSSPPYFFKLATPNNLPEIFLPVFFLKRFKDYADYLKNTANTKEIITNFFTPKLHFVYDFLANNDPDRVNLYADINESEVLHVIGKHNRYSTPFTMKYKPNNPKIGVPELEMRFITEKRYEGDSNSYSPTVCAHKIAIVGTALNPCLKELDNSVATNAVEKKYTPIVPCSGRVCLNYSTDSQCPVNIYNQYFCYKRQMPSLKNNFAFKQDENIDYLFPVINAYIKPSELAKFSDFNKITYLLTDYKIASGLSDITGVKSNRINQISKEAINETQGIVMTFKRSYCSMGIYDYYKYVDILLREQNKNSDEQDVAAIQRYQDKINLIEGSVIPECKRLNGNLSEILENENFISPIREIKDITKVVYKEVKKLKENNIIYGGFNEICVDDGNVDNFNKESKYNNDLLLEDVVVFRNQQASSLDMTKCMLDGFSLSKKECLEDEKVYVYCEAGSSGCGKKFNLTKNTYEYVRGIDCEGLRKKISENAELIMFNIDDIQACYRGGFNANGTVYKKDGSGPEYSCSCILLKNVSDLNTTIFSTRKITPRELGLCVNLEEPPICPAIKYFNLNGEYVDDNLALGKSYEELTTVPVGESEYEKRLRESKYEQHIWRTTETMFGSFPSVFFTYSSGNAEFDASNYCGADDDTMTQKDLNTRCLGGNPIIIGECRGYWKENNFLKPRAVCGKYNYNGKTIYEYRLLDNPCVRYQCSSLGFYDDDKKIAFDEKDILNKTSDIFTEEEIDTFKKNVQIKDFNVIYNDEEADLYKIDRRGAKNGFASWYKKTSSDFAQKVIASQCLTGFLPASGNFVVSDVFNTFDGSEYIDYNVIVNSSVQSDRLTVFNQIIRLQDEKKSVFDNTIAPNLKPYLPFRYCDQKGNWLEVQDLYNKNGYMLPDIVRYFYRTNNTWINASTTSPGFITSSLADKYCERLFCKRINSESINNANVYKTEFLNFGEGRAKEKARVWKHSGGALWDATGAARNSSNLLNTTALFDKINTNLTMIYQDKEDKTMRSEYRHIKRVEGLCYTPNGYYNRGTVFDGNGNFNSQMVIVNSLMSGIVKPQDYTFTLAADNEEKPQRYCDSNGLWGGVQNNCFRACEMLDIYRTAIVAEKSSMNDDKNVKIENHDILNIKVNGYNINTEETERENKFQLYKLASNEKLKDLNSESGGGFYYGDFLTGGASWGRVIVPKNITNRDSGYGGLRYIEVEGVCDSSYVRKDNAVRQYTYAEDRNGKQIKPKRRCYEDGTWGPVFENTQCGLAKTCVQFSFSIKNLIQLNDSYENKNSLLAMNDVLARIIAYDSTRSNPQNCTNAYLLSNPSYINNCVFGNLEASNATLRTVLSSNSINFTNNYLFTTNSVFVCNQSNKTGDYQPGWNLEDRDIGKYFIPTTCLPSNVNNYNSGIGIKKNRGVSYPAGYSYSRETNLEFMYKDQNVKYFDGTQLLGVAIRDRRDRNISIGSKNYNSFQLTTQCLSSVFYNTMNSGSNNTTYIIKDIILECKKEASSNNSNFNYPDEILNSAYNKSVLEPKIITFDECKPKTCGSTGSYQVNASYSYVNSYSASTYGEYTFGSVPTTNVSYIECPAGTAFIVDSNDYNKNNVDYYGGDVGKNYHFIQRFKNIKCNQDKKNLGQINGTTVGTGTYGYNKHGELDFNGIPTRFCTNIEKGSYCQNLTEDYIVNNPQFRTKYCVAIGCRKSGLVFNRSSSDSQVTTNASGNGFYTGNGSGVAAFEEVHILYSLSGDFSTNYAKDSSIRNKISDTTMVGEGSNSGKVCPDGSDVYNEGTTDFSYLNDFYSKFSSSEKTKVAACFQNLEDFEDSLSYRTSSSCDNSTQKTYNGKNICIKYNNDYTKNYSIKYNIRNAANNQQTYATSTAGIAFYSNKSKDYIMSSMINPYFDFGDSSSIWDSTMLTELKRVYTAMIDSINTSIINQLSSLSGNTTSDNAIVFENKWEDGSEETKFISLTAGEIEDSDDSGLNRYLELNKPQNPKVYKSVSIDGVEKYYIKFADTSKFMTVSETKTSVNEEGETIEEVIESEVEIKGEKLLLLDIYEDMFISKFNVQKEVEKTNVKNTLQSSSNYKNVYNYYVSIFSMEDFVNAGSNSEYYNIYYTDIIEKTFFVSPANENDNVLFSMNIDTKNIFEQRDIVFNPRTRNIDCRILKTEEVPMEDGGVNSGGDTEEEPTMGGVMEEDDTNTDNNYEQISCIATESEKSAITSNFDTYFKNFLSVEKNNIEIIDENVCLAYYVKYLSDRDVFNANQTSKFTNGFFMAMKCTPTGWEVLDKPKCKSRCTTNKTVRVDPDGVGDFNFTIYVSNLRHGKSTGMIEVGAKRSRASCSKSGGSLGIFRINGASFSCNNGTTSISVLDSGTGFKRNFCYHGNWRVWKIRCHGGIGAFGYYRETYYWKDTEGKQGFMMCPKDGIRSCGGSCSVNCSKQYYPEYPTEISYYMQSK